MSKVSMAMAVNHGLVGPKERLKSVSDGQQVNIPVLLIFAMELENWKGGPLIGLGCKQLVSFPRQIRENVFHFVEWKRAVIQRGPSGIQSVILILQEKLLAVYFGKQEYQ